MSMINKTIKSLLGLLAIGLSLPVMSQSKDTSVVQKIENNVKCQVMLAGRLSIGSDSTYEPTIALNDILADPILRTTGCADYTITGFTLITTDDNAINQEQAFNCHLTSNMIGLLRKVQKGNGVVIQNVHYRMPNGQTGTMPGIHFTMN